MLGPGGEFGRALLVGFDEFGELGFGMGVGGDAVGDADAAP